MLRYRVVMALLFGIGFVGCAGGSQAGLDPSAGAPAVQPSGHRVHGGAVSFTWETGTFDVGPNGEYRLEYTCASGIALSGAWSKKTVGDNDDLTIEEQYPSADPRESAWFYDVTNTANRQESFKYFVMCATGS